MQLLFPWSSLYCRNLHNFVYVSHETFNSGVSSRSKRSNSSIMKSKVFRKLVTLVTVKLWTSICFQGVWSPKHFKYGIDDWNHRCSICRLVCYQYVIAVRTVKSFAFCGDHRPRTSQELRHPRVFGSNFRSCSVTGDALLSGLFCRLINIVKPLQRSMTMIYSLCPIWRRTLSTLGISDGLGLLYWATIPKEVTSILPPRGSRTWKDRLRYFTQMLTCSGLAMTPPD